MSADEKMSQKIYNYWIRSRTSKFPVIFYVISFLAIFFLIYALNSLSKSSPYSIFLISGNQTLMQQQNSQLPMQERIEEADIDTQDPFIPPKNISREERIAWFKTKLPEFEILRSTSASEDFHSRVLNFLGQGCPILFYIIWLSPAKSFGKREFLTVDTLLKIHPQGCLIIISRSMDSRIGYRILKPFVDRGLKVVAITPDLPFLVKDTPAEAWLEELRSGTRDPGYIPLSQNLSNLIRLAMLYKYGGVYMDADIVVLRNFSEFRNVIGAQSVDPSTKQWTRLNGAVMIFDFHHPILVDFLQEFASTFDGNKWGYNGPYLVSRVMERVGSTPGYNVTILPPKVFYPVDWNKIGSLFKKPEDESQRLWVDNKVINLLYEGSSYAIHMWNKMSRDLKIEEGSVMARLTAERCIVCDDITNS